MRFEAVELVLELVAKLRAPVADIARRDGALADQIRRAVNSVASNLAEGAARTGKDRLHHYRIASGSANEAFVQLRLAMAWGYIGETDAFELAKRVGAVTWRLAHPKPSGA